MKYRVKFVRKDTIGKPGFLVQSKKFLFWTTYDTFWPSTYRYSHGNKSFKKAKEDVDACLEELKQMEKYL